MAITIKLIRIISLIDLILKINLLKFHHDQDYDLLSNLSDRATTVLDKADESMAPLTGKKRKATAGDD